MKQTETILEAVDLRRSFATAEGKLDVLTGVSFGFSVGVSKFIIDISFCSILGLISSNV